MIEGFSIRGLADEAFLKAATRLLLEAGAQDPYGVLYEAGDIQWWWREGGWSNPANQVFWQDPSGRDVALMLFHDAGSQRLVDLLRLPHRSVDFEQQVLPRALDMLAALPVDKPVAITVDERECLLIDGLEELGFHPSGKAFRQMFRTAPAPPERPLPPGYRLVDNRRRPPRRPHPLARRNGPQVAERLGQCSLYRRDLDLALLYGRQEVAAYCLCWLHRHHAVGLFEPVRTEDAHQRKGLGRALLEEGLRRLARHGAGLQKISYQVGNDAARGLYESVGFVAGFKKIVFSRPEG